MSRKGNCYDMRQWNWFSTLKTERGERFESHGQAKADLFDLIEVFYNQQRKHSALAYLSPADNERSAQMIAQAA
jgi:putative transposase